jgi:hypothetical protein
MELYGMLFDLRKRNLRDVGTQQNFIAAGTVSALGGSYTVEYSCW